MVQDTSGVFNPIHFGRSSLRKQSYILFVARGKDGQLRKIPISLNYQYVLREMQCIAMYALIDVDGQEPPINAGFALNGSPPAPKMVTAF